MYQQELGRFMSRDPLSQDGVTVLHPVPDMRGFQSVGNYEHPYAYVRNNPMNAVDPSGLVEVKFVLSDNETENCTEEQKKKAKEAVENACKRIEKDECLPDKLRNCIGEICKGKSVIVVYCFRFWNTHSCGQAGSASKEKEYKDWKVADAKKKICEKAIPDNRVPAMILCATNRDGAGLDAPQKCYGNPPSSEVTAFHEMLHICGSGGHGNPGDITWHCEKACYPKSKLKGADKEKCKCPKAEPKNGAAC